MDSSSTDINADKFQDAIDEFLSLLPPQEKILVEIWFVDRPYHYREILKTEEQWKLSGKLVEGMWVPTYLNIRIREWFPSSLERPKPGYDFLYQPGVWAVFADGHAEKIME